MSIDSIVALVTEELGAINVTYNRYVSNGVDGYESYLLDVDGELAELTIEETNKGHYYTVVSNGHRDYLNKTYKDLQSGTSN